MSDIKPIESGLNFRFLPLDYSESSERQYFFRSANPKYISLSDTLFLNEKYNVDFFLDLRSPDERDPDADYATLKPNNIETKYFPIHDCGFKLRAASDPTEKDYADYYLEIMETKRKTILEIFTFILSRKTSSFIFGCTAGKDRTGVISFLLLSLFGSHSSEIQADYHHSAFELQNNIDLFKLNWIKKGLSKKQYIERMSAKKRTISLLNEMVECKYGNIMKYFDFVGIGKDKRELLKANFKEGN